MSILIKNGKIVDPQNFNYSDILIKNGKVQQIKDGISETQGPCTVIDAQDCLIFPGGIDPHVHMHLPTHAGFSSDDFYSGSKAALWGGTSTIIDFVTPKRGQSIIEALNQRKQEAKNSLLDYKFHVSPVEWTKNTKNEILYCIKNEGVKSFKVYMAYKNNIGLENEDIFKVMELVGKNGGIVTVHAELGDEIEVLRNQFAENKQTTPKYHPLSRPAEMEAQAVKKAIELAKKAACPLYIVHVSTKESIDYIRQAQKNKQEVYAETCPHYLLLNDSKYEASFEEAAPYVLSPPLRKQADIDALWQALADGTIQTVGTDHCPFLQEQKQMGLNDFRQIPNGAGSVEHRMGLLYTYGVVKNKITVNQFVDLTSTKAAKIFGIFPKKGSISVGSDADLLIWDVDCENTISVKNHHQNCNSNIFEGFKTKGRSKLIIKNGEIVFENGKLKENISSNYLL